VSSGLEATSAEGPVEALAPPILTASGITKRFGGLIAVNDVSFDIPDQSIVSLIGPNGAGKTTFFNMLTGLIRPTSGQITLSGKNITRVRPDVITGRGVARTFQNIRLFGAMTALEKRLDRTARADARRDLRRGRPPAMGPRGGAGGPGEGP